MNVTGRIESGRGEAAYFTSIAWVMTGIERHAGFSPFPGTLNVRIPPDEVKTLKQLFAAKDFQLIPDDPRLCSASFKHVWVHGIRCVTVFPQEEARVHGEDLIEIIAACHLKRVLGLSDGDSITVSGAPGEAGVIQPVKVWSR